MRRLLRARTTKTLGAAVVVHLVAALGIRAVPLPAPTGEPAGDASATAEIAIEAPAARAVERPAGLERASERGPAAAAARPGPVLVAAIEGRGSRDSAARGEPISEERPGRDDGGDAGTWFRPTTGATVDLRLGLGAAAPPPLLQREEDEGAGARKAVIAAIDRADAERGFGRGGPVRTAIELAARGPDAPAFGVAVFSVAIGTDGDVQVVLKDASTTGWEALRPAIQTELKGKTIRFPPNSRGLRVEVRVEASEQYPGGARPPGKTGATASASGVHVEETKDRITFTVPQVSLGYRGRRCGVGVVLAPGAIGAGGGCEVGTPLRVVAARILNEDRL